MLYLFSLSTPSVPLTLSGTTDYSGPRSAVPISDHETKGSGKRNICPCYLVKLTRNPECLTPKHAWLSIYGPTIEKDVMNERVSGSFLIRDSNTQNCAMVDDFEFSLTNNRNFRTSPYIDLRYINVQSKARISKKQWYFINLRRRTCCVIFVTKFRFSCSCYSIL